MLRKRRINEKHLPDYYPTLKEKRTTDTDIFCKEFTLFCKEYLSGAVNLYTRQLAVGALSVSAEYFAYFLKMLLEATAGIGAVDVYVDMRNVAAITVKLDTTLIDDDMIRKMFKAAMRAGFACARNEEVLLLEAAIHKSRCLNVRANNSLRFYRILREVIFGNGEEVVFKCTK